MTHDGDVTARTLHVGPTDGDDVLAVRDVSLHVVEHLSFEHDDGVVIPDRRFEQTLGIRRRRGCHHFQTRYVSQPRFPGLGVLRRELERGAVRPPEHDRDGNLAARLVQDLRGRVDDLIEREDGKVPGHELDHRAQARHGGPHAKAREAQLRDGRVHHPRRPELLEQTAADLVGALIDADFLADEEHVRVPLHLFAQRLIERVAVGERGHQSTSTWVVSSAGSGSGLSSAKRTASSTSARISASIASRPA